MVADMSPGRCEQYCQGEVMSGSWGISFSARERDYLGASNTISTRETTATRSTLQGGEKKTSKFNHHHSTGGALRAKVERHRGHVHARQEVQAGR